MYLQVNCSHQIQILKMTTTGSGGMGTRNPGFKYPEFSGEMGLDMLNIRFSSFFKPNFANYLVIFF